MTDQHVPTDHHVPAPGTESRRRRTKVNWELISCGFKGHVLVGTDAAEVGPADAYFVREAGGLRWYRCLRCDVWAPLAPPAAPTRPKVPSVEEVEIPMRGRPLRDRFVLRLIAVEKSLHILVFGLLAVAIFLFTAHRKSLTSDYTRILRDFQSGIVGTSTKAHGIFSVFNRLFTISNTELTLIGVALLAYCVLLALEIVGLWFARRWAEYLTFVETCLLVPYEIYELTTSVSVLKIATLILNLGILAYLAIAHRLFGFRGGAGAVRTEYEADSGWPAVQRATPQPVPPGPVPSRRPQVARSEGR